jgi:hypothetical protein
MYSKYNIIYEYIYIYFHVMSSKRNTPNVKRGSLSMAHADKSWLFWIVLDVSAIRGTFPEEFASSGLHCPSILVAQNPQVLHLKYRLNLTVCNLSSLSWHHEFANWRKKCIIICDRQISLDPTVKQNMPNLTHQLRIHTHAKRVLPFFKAAVVPCRAIVPCPSELPSGGAFAYKFATGDEARRNGAQQCFHKTEVWL